MKRPNLLYIFTDQQRADTMLCYGNAEIETPSLNALAQESFVFDHAYVSQPVCSPSRATMMTGLWPHTCGVPSCNVPLSADVPTIAEHLSDEYATAYMGKWHLGDEIFPQHIHQLRYGFVPLLRMDGPAHTAPGVILDDLHRQLVERRPRRADLHQDIHAVAIRLNHLAHALNLSGDAVDAPPQRSLVGLLHPFFHSVGALGRTVTHDLLSFRRAPKAAVLNPKS